MTDDLFLEQPKTGALETAVFWPEFLLSVVLGFIIPPFARIAEQIANNRFPNVLPSPAELTALRRRGEVNPETFAQAMRAQGVDARWSERLLSLTETLVNPSDLITLYRRKVLNETDFRRLMDSVGVNAETTKLLIEATAFFPGPDDLIRFAVRDVFSPAAVDLGRLNDGLPQRFLELAEQAGLAREWAQYYWAAHWEIPSVNQGYEMYQRGVIDRAALEQLMTAKDIAPGWREALLQISYNPITRVDVRRMYRLGVIDRAEVYKRYLSIGYSPDDAELMTQWTERYESDEDEGPSLAIIRKAFDRDIFTEDEFREELKSLKYSDETVDLLVSIASTEKILKELDELASELTTLYELGEISIEEVRKRLLAVQAPQNFVNQTVRKIELARSRRVKVVPVSVLDRWLEKGFLTEAEYSGRLRAMHYKSEDIALFLTEFKFDMQDAPLKFMPLKTYQKWFKDGIIDEDAFRSRLSAQNYTSADIDAAVKEAQTQ